ncbi:MAG: RNA methyltransferase [Vicinamibacterales bacterium]
MAVIPVVDPDDPRLSSFRVLSDAALIRERGLFVAEGRFLVERVLADSRFVVDALLLNDASLAALGTALASLPAATPVFVAERATLEAITGVDFHRGCLALVHRPAPVDIEAAIANTRLVVVLESVTNADNVGSVFRSAAALGAGAVLLSPTCCDPFYRKAVRTSMGAVLQVPSARVDPWPDALTELRAHGFTLVALSPRGSATDLDTFVSGPLPSRIALLVGTEGPGLSKSAEDAADVCVRIPMTGAVDSLNLGVAAGIVLSRLHRSHGSA